MQKIIFIILISFFSFSFSATNNFEPKSNFWLYFIVISIFLLSSAYFYLKTKIINQDKQIAILFLILLFSFIISYFLDSDYKKTQIEQYKLLQTKN
jgi:drug/metabolite transporter (DMT)-like permease